MKMNEVGYFYPASFFLKKICNIPEIRSSKITDRRNQFENSETDS